MIPFKNRNSDGFTRLRLNAQTLIDVATLCRRLLGWLWRSFAANGTQSPACKSGFTLIEVLVALLVVALVLTPLFMSETNIFAHAVRLSRSLQRTFMLKQFFIDTALKMDPSKIKDKPTVDKKIETTIPPMNFKFEIKKVEKEERFKKFPDLYLQRATAQWDERKTKRKEQLFSFVVIEQPPTGKK